MNRRAFLRSLGSSLLAAPLAAEAQQSSKIAKIGILANSPSPLLEALKEELRGFGWVEGRTAAFEVRYARGDLDRLPGFADELVKLDVDVIIAPAPPAVRAAKQATATIPIVMTAVADPVRDGFVASLARPAGNVTGVASVAAATLLPKILELGKEAIPRMTRVGLLFNAANPLNYAATFSDELREAARALKVELHDLGIRSADDVRAAMGAAVAARVDAVLVVGDPLTFMHRGLIQELAAQRGLPTLQTTREYLAGRGLLSYGSSLELLVRAVAPYVDKILRGARPADLPVVQPSKYELVINLKTAKALGLTIPQSLLLRADQVIE
ncbi:MAG TPA: ABC transporter substrate-binding protein [Candidatus Limnocylindria bacterium]|nr:ABC transporter substrate-binding protein [Candidatus Limnocylindria bacterium]